MKVSANKLDQIAIVDLRFSIWTGLKKLDETDLDLLGTPSKPGVNLGTKSITDRSNLKIFHTIKRSAEKICADSGVKFLGGYAIPYQIADELSQSLLEVMARFDDEKKRYLKHHEEWQNEYILKNEAQLPALSGERIPSDKIEGKISSYFSIFQINSSGIKGSDQGEAHVSDISKSLDSDINKEAEDLINRCLKSQGKPTATIVQHLSSLRKKVQGLAFISPKYSVLVDEITKVEDMMPDFKGKKSKLDRNLSFILMGLLEHLSKPELMEALINGDATIISDDCVDSSIDVVQSEKDLGHVDADADVDADVDFGVGEFASAFSDALGDNFFDAPLKGSSSSEFDGDVIPIHEVNDIELGCSDSINQIFEDVTFDCGEGDSDF